jgi:uncharacterized glyoxalase superfamily protein PhnB
VSPSVGQSSRRGREADVALLDSENHPMFYAGVERDGVVIHLQAASETQRQPGHGAVNVFVTDVDALYRELKSRGARILNEPKDYPYGMRDFDINDLDGNQVCFGMESKQQATP